MTQPRQRIRRDHRTLGGLGILRNAITHVRSSIALVTGLVTQVRDHVSLITDTVPTIRGLISTKAGFTASVALRVAEVGCPVALIGGVVTPPSCVVETAVGHVPDRGLGLRAEPLMLLGYLHRCPLSATNQ